MRYILIILVFISVGANAQMVIKAHPNYVPFASANLLLDDYPNAAAAYSLRKLDKDYAGSAIRVRRSNDNAESDIGFTSSGDLDTATLKTFVGANSGFVVTWYSQGDSTSVNFTQATAAAQPAIMTTGTIQRRSGKPTIRFDNGGTPDWMTVASSTAKFNYLHKSGQSAIFNVLQIGVVSNPNAAYFILDNAAQSSSNRGYTSVYDDRASVLRNNSIAIDIHGGGNYTSAIFVNNFYSADALALLTHLIDNSTATAANRSIIYRNNANEQKPNIFTNTASVGNASFDMILGKLQSVSINSLNGFVSELIFYSTNQSSNRTGISNNINTYYGIY